MTWSSVMAESSCSSLELIGPHLEMGCHDGTDRSECLIDNGQRGSMTTVRSSTLKDLMPDVGPSCRSRSSKIDLMRLESTSACVEDNPGWQIAVSNEALLHASDDKETNLCN